MRVRAPKKTLVVLAVLAGLFLVAVLVMPRLIPADRLRDLAAERLAVATGGEVHLGDASVRIFPRLVVSVADGSIAGSGADLAAATASVNNLQSYRVALRRLEIDVAIGPLLRRRIETGKVRLIEPDVEIITVAASEVTAKQQRPDGAVADSATDAPGELGAAEPTAGLAWGLAIAGVEIRDGHLMWAEAESERRVEISGWQQHIAGADLGVLIARLQSFTAPEMVAPAATDSTQQTEPLLLSAQVDRLTVSGFTAREIPPLEDLYLKAELRLPADADRLTVSVEQLRWGALEATANLEIPATARGDEPIRWAAALQPIDLVSLLPLVLPLAEPPSDPAVATWLASGPVQAGSLTIAASGLLPRGAGRSDHSDRPDHSDRSDTADNLLAEQLLATLTLAARLDECVLQLPATGRTVAVTGDVAWREGRFAEAHLQLTQSDAGLHAAAVVGPAGEAARDGKIRADLTGKADLAETIALAGEVLTALGRTAQADSLPALTGRVSWQGQLGAASFAALADTAAWRGLGTSRGPLRLELTGRGSDIGLAAGLPGAPWIFATAELALQRSVLNIAATGLDHATAAGKVRVSGTLPDEPGLPALELELALERLDLDRLTALMQADQQTAQATVSLPSRLLSALVPVARAAPPSAAATKPPGELIPPELQLAFTAEIRRLILQQAVYTDAVARGTLRRRVLDIPEITLRRATGTITGRAKIDYAADAHGLLTFGVKAHEVPTSALLAPYAAGLAPFWEGTVSGNCSGGCRLEDRDAILASLSVDGSLLGAEGVYHAQELLRGIAPYLGDRLDLMDVRYRKLRKKFKVEQGRLIIENLRIDGLDTDWLGHGWVSFDGQLDVDLNVKLPPGFTPDLGALTFLADGMRGQDGRIALDLKLTGRSAAPKVTVDLESFKAVGQQTLEDKVKKGLGGLLDKFKRN